ncbi:MAG: lipase family protein [Mucinivorans sp.]
MPDKAGFLTVQCYSKKQIMKSISQKLLTLFLISLVFFAQSCDKKSADDTPASENKYLTGVTKEQRFSKADIIKMLNAVLPGGDIGSTPLGTTISDVDVAAITYTTTGVDGKKTEASGIVAMCAETKEYANLLSIQHYTIDMEEAPTLTLFPFEILPVIQKRVVVMADYLGYGASQTPTRQHPYLHITTTGTACVDMIEAAREYLKSKRVKENSDKVELMGFSQGGTSTISTVLEMEKRGISSRIIDAHSGGGGYDLLGMLNRFIAAGNFTYPRTGYIPYLFRGMEYGEQMTLNQDKIYNSSVINGGLLKIFDTKPLSEWHTLLGSDITKVLHPDFYAGSTFNNNLEIGKLVAALKKNSIVSVEAPSTHIKLYHSKTDDFVPYDNAQTLHAKWKNSTLIELSSVGHLASGKEFVLKFMGLWDLINGKQK